MASRNVMAAVVAMLIATAVLPGKTAAAVEIVGDDRGWQVPTGGFSYADWAVGKSFEVGDTLVFNFATGSHDVAEVTKASFEGCNITSPISHHTVGPANVTLNTTGEHYFICTVGRHCSLGQKLSINVTVDSNTPSSSSPTPPAASISAFSLLFMSLVIAFVC